MRPSIFEESERSSLLRRADALKPEARPSFGKFNVNQMVVHCTRAIQMFTGDFKVESSNTPLRLPPIRYMVIHHLPWPKGAPSAPALVPPTDPGLFSANVAELKTTILHIGNMGPNSSYLPHPAFGQLDSRSLGVLVARHLDHHFRQFGV